MERKKRRAGRSTRSRNQKRKKRREPRESCAPRTTLLARDIFGSSASISMVILRTVLSVYLWWTIERLSECTVALF